MTNSKITIKHPEYRVLLLAVLVSAGVWLFNWYANKKPPTQRLEVRVFSGNCGWGYDILVDNRVLIHQVSVPSLPGNCGFSKKEWAEKAARLIINKLENRKVPHLTSFDLETITDLQSIVHAPE